MHAIVCERQILKTKQKYFLEKIGEVAEWPKALVSKASIPLPVS